MLRTLSLCLASGLVAGLAFAAPAQALTMKECSAKYQAARKANTLKGMKWNDFRKAECADEDATDNDAAAAVPAEPATPAAAPAATTANAPAKPAATPAGAPASPAMANAPAKPATAPAAPARRAGAPVFPRQVSQKYSDETPGRARLKTCADQYNANKASGGNGDLKWIQQGGGYWSQCNAKLKTS